MYRDNTSFTANLNYSSIMFPMINYVGTTWNTLMFYEQFQQSLSHLLLKVSCLYYVKWKQKYITIKMQRYCSTRVSPHYVHYLPSFAFHWLWFFDSLLTLQSLLFKQEYYKQWLHYAQIAKCVQLTLLTSPLL